MVSNHFVEPSESLFFWQPGARFGLLHPSHISLPGFCTHSKVADGDAAGVLRECPGLNAWRPAARENFIGVRSGWARLAASATDAGLDRCLGIVQVMTFFFYFFFKAPPGMKDVAFHR